MGKPSARNREPQPNGQTGAGYQPRVVVKFHDYVDLPDNDAIEEQINRLRIGPWSRLADEFPGISLKRLFTDPEPDKLRSMVDQAVQLDPTYRPPNLLSYYVVDCPPDVDPDALARAFSGWRTVQMAYVEGGPTPPPLVAPADDPRWPNQMYLDAAPGGIGAELVWPLVAGGGFAGGAGAGIRFVDLERGWTLNHEDLVAAGITVISGLNQDFFGHGTSVLGQILAVDNALGCIGIASDAMARVVSQWRTATTYSTSEAIMSAVATLGFGDVLLLEAQTTFGGLSNLPVEVEPAVFDAIRLATALGIVVVEAAGNGSNNLDTFVDAGGNLMLNRASPAFRDSGAVMVGAASATVPHSRLGFSNFGSRIDCYGWGESIDTTGDGWTGNLTTTYTGSFGGTSGASPIVSGAALVVQGILQATRGYRFGPQQLRAVLSDPATGTAAANPAVDQIGVMPNLVAIANALNLSTDVYLRDFVGDTGAPHTGAISASPDIILRPVAEANPQASFGQGSGTENSDVLGFQAEAGQDNFVYARVRNRGGAAATNLVATVFWSPVATLVSPTLWTLAGSTTIPSVPVGNVLTVSNPITWPSAAIPATGHYCFVGLIGNAADPAPSRTDFLNWDNFQRFIRENNNVTWRNFNVVNNVPPAKAEPPNFVALPFLAVGAPDEARPMRLEVVAHLAERAEAILEAPLYLLEAMSERSPYLRVEAQGKVGRVPINPHGSLPFKEILFPADLRAECRLLVQIPKEARDNEYEVFVRQLYKEEEVGRVTWRLVPEARIAQSGKGRRRS